MSDDEILAYVNAAAAAAGMPLDAAGARRVAAHLARTAAMAQSLESAALQAHDEPAEVFRPAPFPPEGAA
jgi:hypothetical protein